jgi:large subunit ribosomal protein L11
LILKEAGVEKGSSNPGSEFIGDISMDQLLKVARIIGQKTYTHDIKKAVLQVLGTCVSMGVTVEGEDPREVTKKVKNGEYDSVIYGGEDNE